MTPTTLLRPRGKMTIRVYSVNADGTVTQDRGTVTSVRHGEKAPPKVSGYPPCACPRCRAGHTVTQ